MSNGSSLKKLYRKWVKRLFVLTLAVFAISLPALAGGFQLSIETPGAQGDPQLKEVVLIARTFGCHQPADAKLSATAEGLVNGRRETLPIDLRSIGSGVYAIKRQWPAEGKWVLALTGSYNGMTSSVLVELGSKGEVLPGTRLEEGAIKGVHAKGARRKWIAEDLDAALQSWVSASQAPSDTDDLGPLPLGLMTWLAAGLGASAVTLGVVWRARRTRPA